jgi:glycolate oxidase iron-sulfur subunit
MREPSAKRIIDLPEAQLCCGSAGTYNIDQPDIAAKLGASRARSIIETGAGVVATGNIGCLTQLRMHLARLDTPIPVRHTMQILRDAYAGKMIP